MMKQTTAVGHLYVRPVQTITCHVNPPFEADIGCHVGSQLEKSGSVANEISKSRRMCLII